jgi:hypothetical protein
MYRTADAFSSSISKPVIMLATVAGSADGNRPWSAGSVRVLSIVSKPSN